MNRLKAQRPSLNAADLCLSTRPGPELLGEFRWRRGDVRRGSPAPPGMLADAGDRYCARRER